MKKVWFSYNVIPIESFTGDGRPIKVADGLVGFMAIWKTKKACKAAGHSTKSLRRGTLEKYDRGKWEEVKF